MIGWLFDGGQLSADDFMRSRDWSFGLVCLLVAVADCSKLND